MNLDRWWIVRLLLELDECLGILLGRREFPSWGNSILITSVCLVSWINIF